MVIEEIFINFATSLIASQAHEAISNASAENVDKHMQDSFEKAYGKWAQTELYSKREYSINSYGELLSLIQHPEEEIDPAIQELLGFWREEIYLDPICKAALDDYQHTYIMATVNRLKKESPTSGNVLTKEESDIRTLTMLMEAFSFRLMDEFSRDMPDHIHTLVVATYDVWTEILNASDFFIHDEDLRTAINDVYRIWSDAIVLGETWYFTEYGNPNYYKFVGLDYQNHKPGAENAYHKLADLRMNLQQPLRTLGTHIRSHYDIDLAACALKAFRD